MTAPPLLWDLFCKVVDNFGDIGVCWRLAADLAARGQRVRLWVDDASALDWLAPRARQGQVPGVQVLPWTQPWTWPSDTGTLARTSPGTAAALPPADVWVEAFGCEIAPEFIAYYDHLTGTTGQKDSKNPVWINLEYLSAEGYVERSHGLPSPVLAGPGAGRTKHFFYPGFTLRTGGLLREADLPARQAAFDRHAWLAANGIPAADTTPDAARGAADGANAERLVSLFCYEPAALGGFLAQLSAGPQATRLLVTPGRAAAAVQAAFNHQSGLTSPSYGHSLLSISYLPAFTQTDFDHLLWASDLNFVRGEDSWVRALWAGQPFVWQIYPQHDGAHAAKLEAFLDWLDAPPTLRAFHRVWNGLAPGPLPAPDLPAWGACVHAARARAQAVPDLAGQLLDFALKKR